MPHVGSVTTATVELRESITFGSPHYLHTLPLLAQFDYGAAGRSEPNCQLFGMNSQYRVTEEKERKRTELVSHTMCRGRREDQLRQARKPLVLIGHCVKFFDAFVRCEAPCPYVTSTEIAVFVPIECTGSTIEVDILAFSKQG